MRIQQGFGTRLRDGARLAKACMSRWPRAARKRWRKTAAEIRQLHPGVTVTEVVGDITTPAGREGRSEACPDPDILINNAAGPPPGDFRNWTRDDWIKAIDANMLTPIELIKATVDGMMARKFGPASSNITSAAVKAPIEVLGLSKRRACRPHRLYRRPFAQDRDQQRHHQRPAAPVRSTPTGLRQRRRKAEAEKRGSTVDAC